MADPIFGVERKLINPDPGEPLEVIGEHLCEYRDRLTGALDRELVLRAEIDRLAASKRRNREMDLELSGRLDNAYEQGVKDGRKEMQAEIDRLRLYIKDLQINSPAQDVINENERLKAEVERLKDQRAASGYEADELDRLRAEVARLRIENTKLLDRDIIERPYPYEWELFVVHRELTPDAKSLLKKMAGNELCWDADEDTLASVWRALLEVQKAGAGEQAKG